ncbi:MAG: YoaK family protein, partial [Oscillospiraceae bacterium]|nr:YoaK family protein [Oscillospiraceae bacterium]
GFLPQEGNTAANALVSFVCAMQVQTFRKVRGHAYASTMCIGNMRSGTEALCVYFHTHDREVLHKALTYFGVIGLFAVGAGLGALLTRAFAERGIWVSCALLAVSFLIMFIREEEAK